MASRAPRCAALALAAVALQAPAQVAAQAPADTASHAVAIAASRAPLPAEAATAKITKFSFIAYGDTRNSHDGTALQEVHGLVVESVLAKAALLAKGPDPVRFVVQSGDAVANGQMAEQLNVSFTPLIGRITGGAGIPYFFAAGNHDVTGAQDLRNPQRVTGLANLLAANRNLIPPEGSPRRLPGYPTYAFGYGNTFVLTFDSNIAGDSTQFRWVRSQLDSLDRRRYTNIVVFFHHPAFSSGPHGGKTVEASTLALRRMYMPLFRREHVKLLLVGHEHLFEHWVERYEDAGGPHRIDEIVSGGGGAPLYSFSAEPDLAAYLAEGAGAHVAVEHLVKPGADSTGNPHHYLVVHVDGSTLSIEVVGVGWGSSFAPYPGGRLSIQGQK
jgi:3',5'-cyclic AMP phosphodiesterase CpdA